MELNEQDIAERFSALSREKQKEFLAALKKRGLDFSLLPIVRQPAQSRRMLPTRSSGTGFYGSWSR
jgi:hypothetical protein